MSGWKRKRHPDDVPTPVAVALADFCRRAKAPANPALVREALSALSDADDAAVREITDAAPDAEPLGPFAVVDIVRGTAAKTAAERQTAGHYALVALALQTAEMPEAPPSDDVLPPPKPRAESAKPKRAPKQKRTTVHDAIAPKIRDASSDNRPKPKQPLPGTAFLPKRNLPAPRGRFTRVDPTRSSFEALLKTDSKDALQAIVDQSATRFHVFRTLETGYSGRAGKPLTVADVESALTRHELLTPLEKKERERVLTTLSTARGSASQAAKELGIKPKEIDGLVAGLRLKREASEIADRFIREALDPANLALRLGMAHRQRYLAELRIEKRFADALTRDLTRLLDESAEATTTVHELVALTAKKHAIVPDLLTRAIDLLGLSRRYTK